MGSPLPARLDDFLADLVRQDLSANTRESYRSDLLLFARWFSDTTDEVFSPTTVTPTDIREYRAYLIRACPANHAASQMMRAAMTTSAR
jgi:site-specific recombinase XerD